MGGKASSRREAIYIEEQRTQGKERSQRRLSLGVDYKRVSDCLSDYTQNLYLYLYATFNRIYIHALWVTPVFVSSLTLRYI